MPVDLAAAIVRILWPNRATAGTGFVVSKDGLIATCSHVLQDYKSQARGERRPDKVTIVFQANGEEREATVVPEWWRSCDAGDVAILQLKDSLPAEVEPLPLGSSAGTSQHRFETFGFPAAKPVEGMWGYGTLGDSVRDEAGHLMLQLTGTTEVSPGFSGAPVLDAATRRVVGMVTEITVPDRYGRLPETAFITPTETLRGVCPALRVSDLCPYRGLDAFTEDDAEFFFGRQALIDRLLNKLQEEPRFLAVLGPSGSGKSSVVQAGLIPALRQGKVPGSDRWGVIVTRPADDPFEQLAGQGLASASEDLSAAAQEWLEQHPQQDRLVLVFDQFEELFVSCPESLCQAFVSQLTRLLDSPRDITVVLTMRDEFYSRFNQRAPALLEWLERGIANVARTLKQDELTAIVEKPAEAVGLRFETGLVEAVVRDAMEAAPAEEGARFGRAAVLPLLEFALTQVWERREEGLLTHEAYRKIGRVTGGLTGWADQAFRSLEKELRPVALRVLADLVHLGEEREELPDSRRRRALAALWRNESEREAVEQVVRQLADARLVVTTRDSQTGQETVEIIHDALLREWGLLRQRLQQDRRFLTWRQEMERRVRGWVKTAADPAAQRDEDKLLRGRDLAEAEDWLTERSADLSQAEREFIQASHERQAREEQRWKKLYEEAERQREIALARQLVAQAELIRNAQPNQLELSVLLAVEAMQRLPCAEADQVLRHGLALLPRSVARMTHEGYVWAVSFSPDGKYLATGGGDRTARVWEGSSGREVARMTHEDPVWAVSFSPDGKHLATGSEDHTARVWEVSSGREVARMTHEDSVRAVSFSPDGKYLATGGGDRTARVWEGSSGREVARMTHEDPVWAVSFSPDGKHLATGSEDHTARMWEASSGREVARMTHKGSVGAVSFSPDGKYLATASADKTARVWEASSGREVARMTHKGYVWAVSFSPDGEYLATGSLDETARVWEASSGREVARMTHKGSVGAVSFSPDGEYLATASEDHTARVWEASSGREVARMTHEDSVRAVSFSPDGKYLATGSRDETARVWEASSGREVARMTHEDSVRAVSFSPDGKHLATGSEDHTARMWEASSGREVARMTQEHSVRAVSFSPDGRYLATGSVDRTARVWEPSSGREVARMTQEDSVRAVSFSPDGKYLATGSVDHTARMWEASSGREVARMTQEHSVGAVSFSPDGEYLATASEDHTARVWEASSGREVARMTHKDSVRAVSFSPDGKYLATGSRDETARVWEASSGREVARMTHEGYVWAVSFSPDGEYLATGSVDRTARVWEASSGREVARMTHEGYVRAVSFSPDGKYLATGGGDKTARVSLWRPEDMVAEACSRLSRNLTLEEWRQYVGDEPYRKTCPKLP